MRGRQKRQSPSRALAPLGRADLQSCSPTPQRTASPRPQARRQRRPRRQRRRQPDRWSSRGPSRYAAAGPAVQRCVPAEHASPQTDAVAEAPDRRGVSRLPADSAPPSEGWCSYPRHLHQIAPRFHRGRTVRRSDGPNAMPDRRTTRRRSSACTSAQTRTVRIVPPDGGTGGVSEPIH